MKVRGALVVLAGLASEVLAYLKVPEINRLGEQTCSSDSMVGWPREVTGVLGAY